MFCGDMTMTCGDITIYFGGRDHVLWGQNHVLRGHNRDFWGHNHDFWGHNHVLWAPPQVPTTPQVHTQVFLRSQKVNINNEMDILISLTTGIINHGFSFRGNITETNNSTLFQDMSRITNKCIFLFCFWT